jgi:hypothetical protein
MRAESGWRAGLPHDEHYHVYLSIRRDVENSDPGELAGPYLRLVPDLEARDQRAFDRDIRLFIAACHGLGY